MYKIERVNIFRKRASQKVKNGKIQRFFQASHGKYLVSISKYLFRSRDAQITGKRNIIKICHTLRILDT